VLTGEAASDRTRQHAAEGVHIKSDRDAADEARPRAQTNPVPPVPCVHQRLESPEALTEASSAQSGVPVAFTQYQAAQPARSGAIDRGVDAQRLSQAYACRRHAVV
jgi:hypothetical protein